MPEPSTDAAHDTQLVAVFETRQVAERAHYALLSAGVPAASVEFVEHTPTDLSPDLPPAGTETGFWAALGRLFAPNDEAHALSDAVGQGHVAIIVHPADAAEREVAIEALEGCGPLDMEGRIPDRDSRDTIERQPVATVPTISEPARAHMVRIVEERIRVGWRDNQASAGRVRQYLAPKPDDRQRVQLEEEIIPLPGDPATRR